MLLYAYKSLPGQTPAFPGKAKSVPTDKAAANSF